MTASTYAAICLAALFHGDIHTKYFPAYIEARDSGKMLLIDFGTNFDFKSVDAKKLEGYVICRLPLEHSVLLEGKAQRLIDAPAFNCLQKQPGLVVIDLHNKNHFREAVSVLPQRYTAAYYVAALLDLPDGSI